MGKRENKKEKIGLQKKTRDDRRKQHRTREAGRFIKKKKSAGKE